MVYFLVNKKLTTRKSVSCGFMSKLQGDKKYRLFLAVSPEVAIEYVIGRDAWLVATNGIASVYIDIFFVSLSVKRFLHQYSHDLL